MLKKPFYIILSLLILSILIVSSIPLFSPVPVANTANNRSEIPSELLGFPVVFVQTPENTVDFPENLKGIAIVESSRPLTTENLQTFPTADMLKALPPGWTISYVSGSGISTENLEQENNKNNQRTLQFIASQEHLPKDGRRPLGAPVDDPAKIDSHTYAFNANNFSYGSRLVYQSAGWYAPVVGSYQNAYSVFTTNVVTNRNYFIQTGMLFVNGAGHIAYTNDNLGYHLTDFTNVPYVAGHYYSFFNMYSGTPGIWYQQAYDETDSKSQVVIDTHAKGSYLLHDNNTGVFFENFNTNYGWYSGFTNSINVSNTWESSNPSAGYQRWQTDRQTVLDASKNEIINDVISGSLANGGTASWSLSKMPLAN